MGLSGHGEYIHGMRIVRSLVRVLVVPVICGGQGRIHRRIDHLMVLVVVMMGREVIGRVCRVHDGLWCGDWGRGTGGMSVVVVSVCTVAVGLHVAVHANVHHHI